MSAALDPKRKRLARRALIRAPDPMSARPDSRARRAYKLAGEGLKGKAIGERLKCSTDEANALVETGRALARIDLHERMRLTAGEILLLTSLAKVQRELLAKGVSRSAESWRVAHEAGKSAGWVSATTLKRLGVAWRHGVDSEHKPPARMPIHPREHFVERPDQRPLGFLEHSRNGYIWLTELGWIVVHALEHGATSPAARTATPGAP